MPLVKSFLQEIRAAKKRRDVRNRENGGKSLAAIERTGMIFIHIPKCGGKTVIQQIYGLELHEYFGHANAEFYASLLGPRLFSKQLTFSVVRDPVERTRSAFHFIKSGAFRRENGLRRQADLGDIHWEDFLTSGRLHELSQTYTIFRPQISFLRRQSGKIGCDILLRTGRLPEDLAQLSHGSLRSEDISVANRGNYVAKEISNADERAEVAKVYPEDFELFAGKIVPLIGGYHKSWV